VNGGVKQFHSHNYFGGNSIKSLEERVSGEEKSSLGFPYGGEITTKPGTGRHFSGIKEKRKIDSAIVEPKPNNGSGPRILYLGGERCSGSVPSQQRLGRDRQRTMHVAKTCHRKN